MYGFTVPITNIVRQFSNSISLFQPFIESITNSLEANANKIDIIIDFSKDKSLIEDQNQYRFDSFSIIDNGEGFTSENINSFLTYLSDHKIKLGCKGIGRITWLKVYSFIHIESYVKNQLIKILFHENFSDQDINITQINDEYKSKTIIKFTKIKEKYNNSIILDPTNFTDELMSSIYSSLLVKFFILNIAKKEFSINITNNINKNTCQISNNDIPEFNQQDFTIDQDNHSYNFKCYYQFDDKQMLKNKIYFYADGRVVNTNKTNNIHLEIPENKSAIFLIASDYFDAKVNDERNDFKIYDSPNLVPEVSWNTITKKIQQVVDDIIVSTFPDIEQNNKKILNELKDEFPYLSHYFDKDKSKIKKRKQLIENAKREFEREKKNVSQKFNKLLMNNKINTNEFEKIISDISTIASLELAEYIVYRQQIIHALEVMNDNNEKTEEKIHNIFMKKHTESFSKTNEVYDNNLWLFDDKYMTYIYAASDIEIKKYSAALNEIGESLNTKYRPDLAVFFSNNDNRQKDALIVEFKSCGASIEEKSKSFWEINRNAQAIR